MEIKKCPFCGYDSHDDSGVFDNQDNNKPMRQYWFRCSVCLADGPVGIGSPREAIRKWNERRSHD